jgi:Nucleotidyl transferase AbiEii toxin, Type IV TA system
MSEANSIESTLRFAADELDRAEKRFALVGGLAVSVRAEVRFTRDVDLAVTVEDDREAEALVLSLGARGCRPIASVEHDTRKRLATVRLLSPRGGVKLGLLFASSGLEHEIVEGASALDLGAAGVVRVAEPEELLATKVLSMSERRLQDRIDAQRLIACNPTLDMNRVRENLRTIIERGYDRDEDLEAKLASLIGTTS